MLFILLIPVGSSVFVGLEGWWDRVDRKPWEAYVKGSWTSEHWFFIQVVLWWITTEGWAMCGAEETGLAG